MSGYLSGITPDSFSGIIFALEGVLGTVVLLNGPTGCKFYHSSVSDSQTVRQFEFDPLNYPEKWYFGQPRVPCTYLDNSDYIYGSRDKLEEALKFLRDSVSFELLCIVNSPGAALIGDDLKGIAERIVQDRPVITIETPGFSSDVCAGYETAAIELIKRFSVSQPAKVIPATVNILGISIFHRNYAGDIAEIKRLMGLCGITVNCVLCAGCGIESVRSLPSAALSVVIRPEYGVKTAQYLYEQYGVPFYICDGPPVGFAATEKLTREVCAILGGDLTAFAAEGEKARARVYAHISRVNSLTGLPKGVNFAAEGAYSELYAYINFLARHFGMIPECASVLNEHVDCCKGRLVGLLDELGLPEALDLDILRTASELVFAGGNTIAKLKLRKHIFSGIEISLPSLGYIDVIPKTHLGIQGALLLTEQVINGLIF